MMLSPERLLTLFITPSYLLQLFRCLVFLFTEEEMHALVEISNCCHKIVQTHQLDSSPSFDQKYLFTYNNGEGSIGEDLLKYAPVSTLENMSWGWRTERRTVVFHSDVAHLLWLHGFIPTLMNWLLHLLCCRGPQKSARGNLAVSSITIPLEAQIAQQTPASRHLLQGPSEAAHCSAARHTCGFGYVSEVDCYLQKQKPSQCLLVGNIDKEGLLASTEGLTALSG